MTNKLYFIFDSVKIIKSENIYLFRNTQKCVFFHWYSLFIIDIHEEKGWIDLFKQWIYFIYWIMESWSPGKVMEHSIGHEKVMNNEHFLFSGNKESWQSHGKWFFWQTFGKSHGNVKRIWTEKLKKHRKRESKAWNLRGKIMEFAPI